MTPQDTASFVTSHSRSWDSPSRETGWLHFDYFTAGKQLRMWPQSHHQLVHACSLSAVYNQQASLQLPCAKGHRRVQGESQSLRQEGPRQEVIVQTAPPEPPSCTLARVDLLFCAFTPTFRECQPRASTHPALMTQW